MKKNVVDKDPFVKKIRSILAETREGDLKSVIFAEVQNYSRHAQEYDDLSELFLNLCELMVDCRYADITENVFRYVVASLVVKHGNAKPPKNDELMSLACMDLHSINEAEEYLRSRECIHSLISQDSGKKKRPRRAEGMIMPISRKE